MKKILILLALTVFALTSCGSGTAPSYHIALDPNWYSLDVKSREKNLVGFTTDVLKEISVNKNIELELVMRNWDNLTDGLKHKKYEGIFATIYPYLFNLKKYDFSDLFLATGPVLVTRVDTLGDSLDSFSGKEIGVQAGSDGGNLIETHKGIVMRTYESIPQALNDLARGEIDGAIVPVLTAQAYTKDLYQDKLKIATSPLNDQGIRLLTLHEQNESLIKQFNAGLKELHSSGKYRELLQKWSLI